MSRGRLSRPALLAPRWSSGMRRRMLLGSAGSCVSVRHVSRQGCRRRRRRRACPFHLPSRLPPNRLLANRRRLPSRHSLVAPNGIGAQTGLPVLVTAPSTTRVRSLTRMRTTTSSNAGWKSSATLSSMRRCARQSCSKWAPAGRRHPRRLHRRRRLPPLPHCRRRRLLPLPPSRRFRLLRWGRLRPLRSPPPPHTWRLWFSS